MEYRIFPSIGLARIGNSPDFFVGPEVLGSRGREIGPAGESEVKDFKDANYRVKKQAARFHLYQRASASDAFVPAVLPAGAKVRWSVRVANKKDGIIRPSSPPSSIPTGGLRPTLDPARANRIVDSGLVQIEGASSSGKFLDGTHVGASVRLGELRTDAQSRLMILGANGISKSNPISPLSSPPDRPDGFYNNPNWYDDVGDGPVTAEVVSASGAIEATVGAWVVIAPPDFAPGADSVVSLFGVIQELAFDQGWLTRPTTTFFTEDVYPLLRRARSLRWTHGRRNATGAVVSEQTWNSISDDYPELANSDAGHMTLRAQNRALVRKVNTLFSRYRLADFQEEHLQRWESGSFNANWTGVPAVAANPSPTSLTWAALDGTAGQGFFPGIEGGRILTDPSIFLVPFDFRIDHTKLTPGDITALMAQPWQADFLKCSGNWWPSQRPDIAPQNGGALKMWARFANDSPLNDGTDHPFIVEHVMKFGTISPRVVAGIEVCLEEGRDPAVP